MNVGSMTTLCNSDYLIFDYVVHCCGEQNKQGIIGKAVRF